MANVIAKSLPCGSSLPSDVEVTRIEYEPKGLVVSARSPDGSLALVEFPDLIGFRVLDERDLMEFWPECSSANGRLFEIASGGWLSQELSRPGSLLGPMRIKAREYFLAGSDDCVSVISYAEPVVRNGTL